MTELEAAVAFVRTGSRDLDRADFVRLWAAIGRPATDERLRLARDLAAVLRDFLFSCEAGPACPEETPAEAARRVLLAGLAARGWCETFLDARVAGG